eukprot:7333882-Prymnesium_polylepis.1
MTSCSPCCSVSASRPTGCRPSGACRKTRRRLTFFSKSRATSRRPWTCRSTTSRRSCGSTSPATSARPHVRGRPSSGDVQTTRSPRTRRKRRR